MQKETAMQKYGSVRSAASVAISDPPLPVYYRSPLKSTGKSAKAGGQSPACVFPKGFQRRGGSEVFRVQLIGTVPLLWRG